MTLFTQLEQWFQNHDPDYLTAMNDGISSDEIREFETRIGFQVDPCLQTCFQWHNGQRRTRSWLYNYYWMPLDEVLSAWLCQQELVQAGVFASHEVWSPWWIPWLTNGAGDLICIDHGTSFGGSVGQVIEFYHAEPERNLWASSLDCWLSSLVDSLKLDMWYREMPGGWYPNSDHDVEQFFAIRDPGYPLRKKVLLLRQRISFYSRGSSLIL
jgi:cell wall assembly regulator SMI1